MDRYVIETNDGCVVAKLTAGTTEEDAVNVARGFKYGDEDTPYDLFIVKVTYCTEDNVLYFGGSEIA